ncbi:hypothetical protein P3687_25370, partial [Vibrio parahaemolyticus]|nr:hypothetical protein [Vibrio parahaemolyticus]
FATFLVIKLVDLCHQNLTVITHMFCEKCVEGVVSSANGLVTRHLSIGLNAVFKAIEFPAGVSDLDTGLTNVDRDALSHFQR